MCCNDLEKARHFFNDVLGLEERRATPTSIHLDFYGSQLTLHQVPGYDANDIRREVDAEDVPVPHYGVALTEEDFHRVAKRLKDAGIKFFLEPHVRFKGKPHEQWVLFVLDPSNNSIEIKSFTKIRPGEWI
jgi:extradiol dioxygenase family protein